ncbi:MAG: HD domain-containing protein [Bryobacterales bacterium]|nr:HD domain-containing protein [Bryobacterales bacterium]
MKCPLVADLQPKQQVSAVFLVQNKDVRQKKSGEPYLSLVLCDKSGELDAKMWDNVAEIVDSFEREDFVRVKGETQLFQHRLQLTIHKLSRADEREIDLADFLPVSRFDREEMFAELLARVGGMKNPHLRALAGDILRDDKIGPLYKLAPAAKGIHHAWLGGLLEHVLSLCRLAEFMARHYEGIDPDLLLTGIVLHDLGKIHELSYERTFSYTEPGQLLGHITIAMRIIGEKMRQMPEFPPRLRVLVEHLVLSHHGALEFGSPKVPLFPEALLLHHLDNLDSKMESMRASIAKERVSTGSWTAYNAALERSILIKDRYLADPREPAPDVEPAPKSEAAKQAIRHATLFGEQLASALGKKDS